MKNLLTLFCAVLLMAVVNQASAQNVWDLQKCIDYAFENNILIKQQALASKYGENQVRQAKSDKLPNLNAQVSGDMSFGRSLTYENTYDNINSAGTSSGISTNFTLFNGGILSNTVKHRELDLEATILDLQKTKDDITLLIAGKYLEILFAEEIELVTEGNIEVTKQQIERTRQLVEAGSLAKGSLLEIEAQQAREELQLVNDKNRTQLAYLDLYQLLELPISESFKIEKPTLPDLRANLTILNALDVYNNAINVRPEIKAAQIRVESAIKQLEVAKGYRYPNLNFGASYFNQYNNQFKDVNGDLIAFGEQWKNNGRSSLGLTLNIPIFNRNQVKINISNAEMQIADYKYRLQSERNILRKDLEMVFTNALASFNSYMSADKAVQSMQEAFRYTEEKFNVGMINSVDYNVNKTQLTNAQSELLQAKYEYIFRTKILDFYNGIPITL